MAIHKLAAIIKHPSNEDEFLLAKESRPPKFGEEEYDSYTDSDLWDLPSTQLNLQQGESQCGVAVEGAESVSEKVDLAKFDLHLALNQVLGRVGYGMHSGVQWRLWKYVEEPEFGPRPPVHTVFITGKLVSVDGTSQESCKWMSIQRCLAWLVDVKPSCDRVGPLVVIGLLNDLMQSTKWKVPPTLCYQEYPPGVVLVPMGSRTAKPFCTTNLVVFAPNNLQNDCGDNNFVAHGDALIVDPGCKSKFHKELMEIIVSLPRKLVVFVTHHHHDHVDGLSVTQKYNPDATLLAHKNTMGRIRKGDWSLGYTSISGNEEICISGQRLQVICALGHTDGHMALLHTETNSLIVGDHCVGHGSAILDVSSGGNMAEYFQTTYKFLELSPHVIVPMHGRVNLWPKNMLCQYLKNRRYRESSILKAIENGRQSLFDIVVRAYPNVDPILWIPASSNVRVHMDHLACQDKLPKEFSLEKFQKTCRLHFLSRWLWAYLSSHLKDKKLKITKMITVGVVGIAVVYSIRNMGSN